VSPIDQAVARLDAWLETMRNPIGYAGPVAHWWQQSLLYTGPGFDWRYEGVIAGYLTLWRASGDACWLNKARRAGNDLLIAQQLDGHYPASAFEINPSTAGTPHEAAADLGLLLLAASLRELGDGQWEQYAACAARNLRLFYLGQLWDEQAQSFRDDPRTPTFVPNKAATAAEAFFLLAELTDDEALVTSYALPNLERIITHQVKVGPLAGAIAQNSFGPRLVEKYFPIYIARCVPALVRGYAWSGKLHYLEHAMQAMEWIARQIFDDGLLPTVVYGNGSANRFPAWLAPLGDVLRAADLLRPHGFDANLSTMQARLLAGQDTSGGIQTATGFAAQAGGRPPVLPDLRDLLHVVGWCDKAFRYLATLAGPVLPQASSGTLEAECVFRGRVYQLHETPELVELHHKRGLRYRWQKGELWAEVATEEFWLR
jgi:hypothetical protein